ncbi:TniQ family protein [Rhodanobacter thiooxydans]|uniref:TniQ family protein n=1 Tax=Rhodanobacter thiooxydans TaxID=416169 RepID=UPI000AF5818A|nr:TniQ family protein [Rhodanobacter thiooxydans]
MLSPYAVVARIAALNQLGMSAFERETGLSTGSEPLAIQLQRPERANKLADLLGFENDGSRALFLGAMDLRAWVPWPIQPYTLQTRMGFASALAPNDCWLRYCPLCLNGGYHCLLFQLPWVKQCPIHQSSLLDVCLGCGSVISAYDVHSIVSAPFRCPTCQRALANPAQLLRGPKNAPQGAVRLLSYLIQCTDTLDDPTNAKRHAVLLSLTPPSVAIMDQVLQGIFLSMKEGAALLDEIGQLPDATAVTILPVSADRVTRSILAQAVLPAIAGDTRQRLGIDAWKYLEHQVGVSLIRGAQDFVLAATAFVFDRMSDNDDEEADLLSRATLTATQFSMRQLALEWMHHACDVLLSEYAPGAAVTVTHPDGLLAWMLAGPVSMLGRWCALQVLREQGWIDTGVDVEDRFEASAHVAMLATEQDGQLVLSLYGVSDALLLASLHLPDERAHAQRLSMRSRWQPRPRTSRGDYR